MCDTSLTQGPVCDTSLTQVVQAVRVEIERVCALLEEITIFYPDDQ